MRYRQMGVKEAKIVTRVQLFELVWNEPMRALAPKFGLSDVGLAKICRGAAVPLPPMGYWARIENKRRRPALPPAAHNQSETVEIVPSQIRHVDVTSDLPQDIADLVASLNQRSNVDAPATCPRNHTMFEKWDALDRRFERFQSDRRPSLSAIEKRRRRILYALIREVEGWKGRLISIDQQRFKVEYGKDDVEFTLREPSNKIERPLTQQEQRWYPHRDSMPELQSSGKLRFLLDTYFDRPIQKSWADLQGRPMESRLRQLLIGLLIALSESRRRRLHWEEEERCRIRREQERLAAEERLRAEQTKLKQLKDDAAAWFEAGQIRLYIAARLRLVNSRKDSAEIQAWAHWASQAADSMDPLRNST